MPEKHDQSYAIIYLQSNNAFISVATDDQRESKEKNLLFPLL